MKKAVEITTISIIDSIAVVEYISGTVRKYQVDKLPGTVRRWMDEHQEIAIDEMDEETSEVLTTIEEPFQYLTVTETAVTVPESVTGQEREEGPTETIQMAKVAWELIKATARLTVQLTGSLVRTARDVAPVILMILGTIADWGMTAYYWTTTWVPIGARKVAFIVAWDILPASRRMAGKARRMAVMAYRMTGMALGASRMAVMALGRWILMGILIVTAVALKTAQMASEGWQMRSEIIEEGRAA